MSDKHKHRTVRACLITSARSGSGTLNLAAALAVLSRQHWEVALCEKQEKGEAVHLARKAAEDGYDPVVNCGGDGTLNEIVEALSGTPVAVGTIPGGTENVWSREVGISRRSEVAASQLVNGVRAHIDVGTVKIGGEHTRHFLMMAGLGADGAIMARVSRSLKQRLGPLAVGVAATEALPAMRAVPVEVEFDDIRWQGQVTQVIVGNTRRYGGFTQITAGAYADDGLLDVCLFTTDGLLGAGKQMLSLLLRQHPNESSAEQYRAARVVLRSPSRIPLQLDGSAIDQKSGTGPVEYEFSVIPHGLTVLIPRTYDGELFEPAILPDNSSRKHRGKKRKEHR